MNPTEEIRLLEQLLDQFIAGVMEVLQSGEALSDEFQGMLAQEIEVTVNRIDQLRSENPSDALPPGGGETQIPPLDPGPYPSSNINSFKYNPDTQQLFIKFHGKDTADSGPVYQYQGVPLNIYDVFRRGAIGPKTSGSNKYHTWHKNILPSLGAAAYALIKEGGYQYQRMS